MTEHQGSRVLAGFAILAGIIALTAIVFFLADIQRAFKKHYSIVGVFPTAEGLRVGSPVWVAGHEVGTVTSIAFRPVEADSIPTLAVRLSLPREHQALVRRDSHIRLTKPKPIGDPVIAITPGTRQAPMLQDGDTLIGVVPATVEAAFNGLVALRTSLDSLIIESKRLTPLASRRQQQLTRIMRGLTGVRSEFAAFSESFGKPGARNITDPEVRLALSSLSTTAKQLGPLFNDAAKRYQDPALRGAFTSLKARADALSVQFDSLSSVMQNGSLSRFAQDSAITKALNAAKVELDSVMAITKRNPLRYWLGDGSGRVLGEPLKR